MVHVVRTSRGSAVNGEGPHVADSDQKQILLVHGQARGAGAPHLAADRAQRVAGARGVATVVTRSAAERGGAFFGKRHLFFLFSQ